MMKTLPVLLGAVAILAACGSSSDHSVLGDAGSPSGSSSGAGSGSSSGQTSGSGSGQGSGGSSSSGAASTSSSSGSGSGSGSTASSSGSSSGAASSGSGSGSSGSGSSSSSSDAGGREAGNADSGGSGDGATPPFDPCPNDGTACKVLPLGDSITFGTPTNNGGYRVELFSKAVGNSKHVTFIGSQSNGPNTVAGMPFPKANEGHPGWTIAQINGISTTTMALRDSPQIVLLHIGTNDMPAMSAGAPDRLGQLIDKIVTALPNSLLAVSSIIPFPAEAANVSTYNAAVPGVVQQRATQGKHVIFVEMFKGFPSNGLGGDGIHPNDNIGYPFMGDTWYAAIQQYLH